MTVAVGCPLAPFMLRYGAILERILMDLSIKGVPEEQVALLRERAKANHRSLQGELRALIDAAISVQPRRLSIEEIVAKVGKLGLQRSNEAVRLIREDRDR
ncbi:MAG TPA: hypothetical protein VGF57_04080 [Roseiarcus sp.]